jgi:hypothetical protein
MRRDENDEFTNQINKQEENMFNHTFDPFKRRKHQLKKKSVQNK